MTDEIEVLTALYTSPEAPCESVVQRQRQRLMTTIEAAQSNEPQHHGRSRRRRLMLLVATPIAAVALAAAGWEFIHDAPRNVVSFGCVADGKVAVLPNDGTPPVEACRAVWESGAMLQGITTAPPLVACISPTAVVEVIEAVGEDPCEVAGMGTWTKQGIFEAVGAAVRAVRVKFHDRLKETGNGCATEQDWRNELGAQVGAKGWTIATDQVAKDRRCFDVGSIDPSNMTVYIVGIPGGYSIGCDPRRGC